MALFRKILDSVGPEHEKRAKDFAAANPNKVIELFHSAAVYDSRPDMLYLYDLGGYCYYLRAVEPPWPAMTRAEALSKGLVKYWTGNPCKNGHVAQRYVKGGACEHCVRGYQRDRNRTGLSKLTLNVPDTHRALVEHNAQAAIRCQSDNTVIAIETSPDHAEAIKAYAEMLNAHNNT